jgi:uncharacterized protein (TIRG00374 family)
MEIGFATEGGDGGSGGTSRSRRLKLALTLAIVAICVAVVLVFFRPSGLGEGLRAAEEANPWWLGLAFIPSALAFVCYAALFRAVVARSSPEEVGERFTWPSTLVSTLAAQAATTVVSAGGAGALAVMGWVLRKAGLQARDTVSRLMAFLVLLYAVYVGSLLIFGLGLGLEIIPGKSPPGVTLIPALLAAIAIVLVALIALLPSGVEALIQRVASGTGKRAAIARKVLRAPATLGEGIRLAWKLVRRPKVALRVIPPAIGYWACNIGVLWMTLQAVGEPTSVPVVVQAFFVGMLANLIPLLPGGAGTVEGAMTASLVAFGVPAGPALAAALTYRLIAFWLPTLVELAAWTRLPGIVRRWEPAAREQPAVSG